ncbi:MAG TPA: GGDEF domain-containing protein [Thermoanaerobaculia bacterium]
MDSEQHPARDATRYVWSAASIIVAEIAADYPTFSLTEAGLLNRRADQALYAAKAAGRNRVIAGS